MVVSPVWLPFSLHRAISANSISMRFTLIAALAALTTSVAAAPSQSSHVLHERRNSPLRNWVKRDKLERDYVLPMRIGLTQRNLEKGHDLLMEV